MKKHTLTVKFFFFFFLPQVHDVDFINGDFVCDKRHVLVDKARPDFSRMDVQHFLKNMPVFPKELCCLH